MKAAALGAAYLGKFEQIPESKVVDVLWEARQPAESCKTFKQLQVSLVGGKMTPVKPVALDRHGSARTRGLVPAALVSFLCWRCVLFG